jgi:hypothetical protein
LYFSKPVAYRALMLVVALLYSRSEAFAQSGTPRKTLAWSVEVLGGVMLGSGGAFFGAAIGSQSGSCKETEGWFGSQGEDCSAKLPGIFLGGLLGYSIGNPLGIFLAGTILEDEGSFQAAFLGGLLGEVIAIPIGFILAISDQGGLALASIAFIPALLGTTAYRSGGDPRTMRAGLPELERDFGTPPSTGGISTSTFSLNLVRVRF